jgi:protein O-GlcNAc transferase
VCLFRAEPAALGAVLPLWKWLWRRPCGVPGLKAVVYATAGCGYIAAMNRQQRRAADRQAKGTEAKIVSPGGELAFAQGVQLHQAGRTQEADQWLARVPAGDGRSADALHLRGVIALQTERFDAAVALIAQAIAQNPTVATFHNNLGAALRKLGRTREAADAFRKALTLRPDFPLAVRNLAGMAGRFEAETRLTEAADAWRVVVDHAPYEAAAAAGLNGLANVLTNLGAVEDAVAAYRQALARTPGDAAIASNLLMTLHSLASTSAADLLAEARAVTAGVTARPRAGFANDRDPDRVLRVGYVSADFRTHPVGFFLERVLGAHDPARLSVTLYSNSPYADEVTQRLKASAAGWRRIDGLDDAAAAAMMATDGIDILVDLAGHTGSNRLPLFAERAAPVQASWLGYFGTTGVAAMDHILADTVVAPPGEDSLFSEEVVRLRAPYLAWSPPQAHVPVGPFPGLNGAVTFGCFNNRAKLGPEVLDAWARILGAVEDSRLFLKSWSLADPDCRARLAKGFAARGVDPQRLIFEGLTPRLEALAAYGRVDIALDPFPFGGCTTTADTLWMGVPLVTLAGTRWSGRMSQTILESVGLAGWVAADVDAYVARATAMAQDLAGLAPLRASLRARLEASLFCDGAGLARALEAAYRRMWGQWLAETDG